MPIDNLVQAGTKKTIDGKEYSFKLNFKSFKILAQKYGTMVNAHNLLNKLLENKGEFLLTEANLEILEIWTYAALIADQKDFTIDRLEDLLTPFNMWQFFGGAIEALVQATPQGATQGPPGKA